MIQPIDFSNETVSLAQNPSKHGYHHGPIPVNGGRVSISRVNTHICDIAIDASMMMCGRCFSDNPSFYRHLRRDHPESASLPGRSNVKINEKVAGESAIKRWVLTGGWRNARYLYEPGFGPEKSLAFRYAEQLEQLASEDAAFRLQYGQSFHRRSNEAGIYNRRPSRKVSANLILSENNSNSGSRSLKSQQLQSTQPMPDICHPSAEMIAAVESVVDDNTIPNNAAVSESVSISDAPHIHKAQNTIKEKQSTANTIRKRRQSKSPIGPSFPRKSQRQLRRRRLS